MLLNRVPSAISMSSGSRSRLEQSITEENESITFSEEKSEAFPQELRGKYQVYVPKERDRQPPTRPARGILRTTWASVSR